jgi:capsular exopolysaccharide synthesis family protein
VNEQQTTYLQIIWRRKSIIAASVLTFAIVAALVSATLQKVYSTSSTLVVRQNNDAQSFDAVQAAQVVARTYADILKSSNIAQLAATRLGGSQTKDEISSAVSVETVPETLLIKITAEDPSPTHAQEIANAYAEVFRDYARTNLDDTTGSSVRVGDRAAIPDSPVRPKPTLYTLLATLMGLALGLALAFLRERLDSRIRTLEEIEQIFDVPVLARVPARGKTETSIASFTEAYRVLRTNLQFATPEGAPRTIAVTSMDEGEGKTTTASQLALVTAATGTNVLVVEADLRRPALQHFFVPGQREPLRPGLSNYFLGGASLQEIIHSTTIPTVEFVPSGPTVPSLSGLLESSRGRTVIEDLAACADVTILDCPPLGLGADASTVAGRVDGVVLVINLETATERSVRNALRQLEAVRARVVGFVLNRDKSLEPVYYGYLEDQLARQKAAAQR